MFRDPVDDPSHVALYEMLCYALVAAYEQNSSVAAQVTAAEALLEGIEQ